MATRSLYRTTDLYLAGDQPLDPVVLDLAALGVIEGYEFSLEHSDGGHYNASPRYHINLNAAEPDEEPRPQETEYRCPRRHIETMLDGVEQLVCETKRIWTELAIREFNMGFDVGEEPKLGAAALTGHLPPETLSRIAAVNATLAWTLYPA